MARVAVEIPKVGLVMETARLVRWLKNVGDTVTTGEPLLEVETEKSVIEIESMRPLSGKLMSFYIDDALAVTGVPMSEMPFPEGAAATLIVKSSRTGSETWPVIVGSYRPCAANAVMMSQLCGVPLARSPSSSSATSASAKLDGMSTARWTVP